MNRMEAATTMACARRWHKRGVSITNVELAVDFKLCEKKDAVKFCQSLGLYAYGKKGYTDIDVMIAHLKRTGLICI